MSYLIKQEEPKLQIFSSIYELDFDQFVLTKYEDYYKYNFIWEGEKTPSFTDIFEQDNSAGEFLQTYLSYEIFGGDLDDISCTEAEYEGFWDIVDSQAGKFANDILLVLDYFKYFFSTEDLVWEGPTGTIQDKYHNKPLSEVW